MKLERTDGNYPLKSNLTREEAKTIYVPVQATMPRVFTKNDQYGISSPQIETHTTASRSNLRGVSETMTRIAFRQVRTESRKTTNRRTICSRLRTVHFMLGQPQRNKSHEN